MTSLHALLAGTTHVVYRSGSSTATSSPGNTRLPVRPPNQGPNCDSEPTGMTREEILSLLQAALEIADSDSDSEEAGSEE